MSAPTQSGAYVAGYRLERQIGRGGMGVVYLAEQVSLRRYVALKVIAPELAADDDFRARFERESFMSASLDHPNIVPVHEAGEADGVLFISMRYVEGSDLRLLIRSHGALGTERAASVTGQVAAALDAAHAAGLVHRDVKPANVLITGPPGAEHAYLTDFGLTKHVSSRSGLTQTGQWVGTLDYVSPEQISGGALDARVDVYSLGCVLYETLTGKVPFAKESDVAKLWAHLNESAPRVTDVAPGVPAAFDDVVARSLAKLPEARYPSAGDLARAAQAACNGRPAVPPERSVALGAAAPAAPAVTRRLPASHPPAKAGRGKTVALVLITALIAAGAASAALLASGATDRGSSAPAARPTTVIHERTVVGATAQPPQPQTGGGTASAGSTIFHVPSGHVSCQIDQGGAARCAVPRVSRTFELPAGGRARIDGGAALPSGSGYETGWGTSVSRGSVTCTIPASGAPHGIVCQNRATGHGFEASAVPARRKAY